MDNIYKQALNYLPQTKTQLSPIEEVMYQSEKNKYKINDYDYDMRGYYKEYGGVNPILSSNSIFDNGHYPDTYKLPNHPTFSTGSKYNNYLTPNGLAQGGAWEQNPSGSWKFYASPYNLTQHSPQELQEYFNKYEQGNNLILPY